MSRLGKKILIVEGPAGSGKSFLVDALAREMDVPKVSSSLGKRGFDTQFEPALGSAINDYAKLTKALFCDAYAVVIDRLVISQMVYGTLRDPNLPHNQGLYLGHYVIANSLEQMMSLAVSERNWRLGPNLLRAEDVAISILVVLPELQQMVDQRKQTGKEYPWPPEKELETYRAVAEALTESGADITIYGNKGSAQLDRLLSALATWSRYHRANLNTLWRGR